MNSEQLVERLLRDLRDANKAKEFLARLLSLWPIHGHERSHYRAVANHQKLYHQEEMLKLLEDVEEYLENGQRS